MTFYKPSPSRSGNSIFGDARKASGQPCPDPERSCTVHVWNGSTWDSAKI